MHAGRNTSSLARVLIRHFVINIILVGWSVLLNMQAKEKAINHYIKFISVCRFE